MFPGFSCSDYQCCLFQGDRVPPPMMSFEATGFPSEILREVRKIIMLQPGYSMFFLDLMGSFFFLVAKVYNT